MENPPEGEIRARASAALVLHGLDGCCRGVRVEVLAAAPDRAHLLVQLIEQRDARRDVQADHRLFGHVVEVLDQGAQRVSVRHHRDGLAAPQIGLGRRVIVVDTREEDVVPFGLVNPVIVETGEERDRGEEGCLSIPGLKEIVERPSRVVVEGLDRDGNPVRIEADGLLARVLQHEVDHLDGILFLDRVSALKRTMLLKRWKKLRK